MSTDSLEARRAWFDLRHAARSKHREEWDATFKGLMGDRVAQTPQPSMSVIVNTIGHGRYTLALPLADPIHPRTDTVCAGPGKVQVVQGIPAASPAPPAIPYSLAPLAHITIPANATSITAANIKGVNP